MDCFRGRFRSIGALVVVAAAALVLVAGASAHARVSPAVSVSGELQLYSLAVPTEEEGKTTTQIVLNVPKGFSIDSFAPSPGWKRVEQSTGSGDNAVIQKVTWTGGSVPTGEDSLFQFLAQPASSQTYTFQVQQTYSDGSIVNWSGPESSDSPAPTIEAKSSLGDGTSIIAIVALVVGAAGLVIGGIALLSHGNRQLA
jgi:uncharacterized protein YcnI